MNPTIKSADFDNRDAIALYPAREDAVTRSFQSQSEYVETDSNIAY